jgi:hypothetical protein
MRITQNLSVIKRTGAGTANAKLIPTNMVTSSLERESLDREKNMKTGILAIALLVGSSMALPVYGQVGQDLKNAGKDTKDATKTGAKKTANGTKKAAKTTGHNVKKDTHKAADKVADKTDTSK